MAAATHVFSCSRHKKLHPVRATDETPTWPRRFYETGPKENLFTLKSVLWKLVTLQNVLGKLAPLQNVLGKFVWTFSGRIFWQNNDQCRYFMAAGDSKPISLSWMRWQPRADVTGDQPISLTTFILLINGRIGHEGQQWPHNCVNLKYTVIFLAPLVHTELLLVDITFTPHNPTRSRYLTW